MALDDLENELDVLAKRITEEANKMEKGFDFVEYAEQVSMETIKSANEVIKTFKGTEKTLEKFNQTIDSIQLKEQYNQISQNISLIEENENSKFQSQEHLLQEKHDSIVNSLTDIIDAEARKNNSRNENIMSFLDIIRQGMEWQKDNIVQLAQNQGRVAEDQRNQIEQENTLLTSRMDAVQIKICNQISDVSKKLNSQHETVCNDVLSIKCIVTEHNNQMQNKLLNQLQNQEDLLLKVKKITDYNIEIKKQLKGTNEDLKVMSDKLSRQDMRITVLAVVQVLLIAIVIYLLIV